MKRKIVAIIPARYASSRFPGKPLALIQGKTMIERVYTQVKKTPSIEEVIVATDDERIKDEVTRFGGRYEMTATHHPSGTDRLAEIAARHPEFEIIVNVQGDEPLIDPESVERAIEPFLKDETVEMSTLAWRIKEESEAHSPQVVKVVVDVDGNALYFSRESIPHYRDGRAFGDRNYLGHVGLYVYTRQCLLKIAELPPSPLEQAEALEQLRALENRVKIRVSLIESRSLAVDVPEDVTKVEQALKLLAV